MATQITENVVTGIPQGMWNVDPAASRVGFDVRHMWGLATVHGRFADLRGTLVSRKQEIEGELSIDAASVKTKNPIRDNHLRSKDFFDVERHPLITFTTVGVTDRNDGVTIAGDLRIGPKQVRLQLPVTVEDRGERIVLRSAIAVPRKDVGLAWNVMGTIRGDAQLTMALELLRADADT
jgi:polyisoprenoid-binding protein YceI